MYNVVVKRSRSLTYLLMSSCTLVCWLLAVIMKDTQYVHYIGLLLIKLSWVELSCFSVNAYSIAEQYYLHLECLDDVKSVIWCNFSSSNVLSTIVALWWKGIHAFNIHLAYQEISVPNFVATENFCVKYIEDCRVGHCCMQNSPPKMFLWQVDNWNTILWLHAALASLSRWIRVFISQSITDATVLGYN